MTREPLGTAIRSWMGKASISTVGRRVRNAWRALRRTCGLHRAPDRFLRDVEGVVHVGANDGEERDQYEALGLRVLWVEPIPEVFARLKQRIQGYDRQRAVRALITDKEGGSYDFHVSSNHGASSSIFGLLRHRELWPEVGYKETLSLKSMTLQSLINREGIVAGHYQALIVDTQGAELLVLKGALGVLPWFKYVKLEVADFESYAGGCQLQQVSAFMDEHGFREMARFRFAGREGVGNYFDIVYERCT